MEKRIRAIDSDYTLKLQNVDVRRYKYEICLLKELFMNN